MAEDKKELEKKDVKRRDLEPVDEEKKQYIVVKIGDEQYGLDISYVDNIGRMQKITIVPKVQYHYIGIINLRGEIVPVMSIRRKMGLGDDVITNKSRIIILKMEEQGLVGLLVDEVREVIDLGESEIDRNVKASRKSDALFINGIGKNGNELVSIFEVTAILDDVSAS